MSFDRFSVDMKAEGKEYSYEGGHAVFSQKLGGEQMDFGALLIGYEEERTMQYEGDNIYTCWSKGGEKTIKDMMRLVGDQCWTLKDKATRRIIF